MAKHRCNRICKALGLDTEAVPDLAAESIPSTTNSKTNGRGEGKVGWWTGILSTCVDRQRLMYPHTQLFIQIERYLTFRAKNEDHQGYIRDDI